MSKQIIFNEEARAAMKKGIDKLAMAVTMTLGPRGRAVVVEKSYGAPQVTFDGVTVAKEIELEDKYENLGAEFLKQAADKTNDNVGDGTTTSVVLAHALIEEGEKAIKEKGFNVIQLAEELKKQSVGIIAFLESQKEEINDVKKIQEVATLSAKDKEIGNLIAEVIETVGRDGVVTIDDSNTVGNSHEIVEGMQFDRGYISQYMITNQERMESVLEDPFILVTDKKISSIQEILPVLEKIIGTGRKELVIFAEDIDGEALTTLVLNKIRGVFTVLGVKAPGFGDRKKEMLQDIAIVTGSTFVSEDIGKKFDSIELSDLGSARRVVSDKDKTTIVDGKGDKKLIGDRVTQLKAQIKKTESDYDREKLEERVGKLSGGVAVIKVGAPTESAQKELKQRVEDAVAATRAAMEEGIVPGGGIALLNAAMKAKSEKGNSAVVEAAHNILMHAIEAPITAIVLNSGENPSKILSELKQEKRNEWHGFDAFENAIRDLKIAGIIDPLKVTKTAFTNAISVAAVYLTIGAAVTEIPKQEEPHNHGPAGMDY